MPTSGFQRIDADCLRQAHHPAIRSRKPKTPVSQGLAKAGDPGIEPGVAVLETGADGGLSGLNRGMWAAPV
jgi:hypothetical protein